MFRFIIRTNLGFTVKNLFFAAGINISNIGAKISYTEGAEKDFIPDKPEIRGLPILQS